jgi:hypothetical protein
MSKRGVRKKICQAASTILRKAGNALVKKIIKVLVRYDPVGGTGRFLVLNTENSKEVLADEDFSNR